MMCGCGSLPAGSFHPAHLRQEARWLGGQPAHEVANFGVLPQGVEAVPLRAEFPLRKHVMEELVAGRTKPGDAIQHLLPRVAEAHVALVVLAAGDQMMSGDPDAGPAAQFAATRGVIGIGGFARHTSFPLFGRTVREGRPRRSFVVAFERAESARGRAARLDASLDSSGVLR